MSIESKGGSQDALENNRQILAEYPRGKLIQLCLDVGVVASKPFSQATTDRERLAELTDDELRSLALAATQGM